MTQECVLVFETEKPIPMTCSDATGIEKGAILKITDPFTVALAAGDADVIAGIAAEEKVANDGKVKIGVYRGGIFKGTAGGTCTVGKSLMTYNGTGDDNDIIDATNAGVGGATLGIALETAANNETVLFELNPGCNTNVLA
jgi:hypothetical protein